MNSPCALALCASALLLPPVSLFGGAVIESPGPSAANRSTPFPVEVPAPIDISADGQLLLLFLPGGQGFELVDTGTGRKSAPKP
jgi:hypothetical protein